ncbi:MAG TPA: hypothetical protein VG148_17495 [Pyrinomonadaceae bacterium]|nr:hypothetical protein [Pyrinomonadaceae bacterium]
MRYAVPKILTSLVLAVSLVYAVPAAQQRQAAPAFRTAGRQTAQQPTPTPRRLARRGGQASAQTTPKPTSEPGGARRPGDGDGGRGDDVPPPPPTPTPTPEKKKRGLGPAGWAAIIGGIVGGGIIARRAASRSDSDAEAEKLSEEGPQLPDSFSPSDLRLVAFLTGNWPLFIAYELEEPGVVTLTIEAEGFPPFVHEFGGTRPGRHEEMLRLPAAFGRKPRVAAYALRALSDRTPSAQPVPLHLHAFGAGDKAVGSSGFDRVSFLPDRVVSGQQERASYSFHAIRDFNKASADFMRLGRGSRRQIVAQLVDRVSYRSGIRSGQTVSGEWNCQPGSRPSVGIHELYVRGWRGVGEGGDWMITSSVPQRVLVQ